MVHQDSIMPGNSPKYAAVSVEAHWPCFFLPRTATHQRPSQCRSLRSHPFTIRCFRKILGGVPVPDAPQAEAPRPACAGNPRKWSSSNLGGDANTRLRRKAWFLGSSVWAVASLSYFERNILAHFLSLRANEPALNTAPSSHRHDISVSPT